MNAILAIAASNVILSALLAILAIALTRIWRSPQLAHGLWLLVLLKLITPPLISLSPPIEWLAQRPGTLDASPLRTAAPSSAISNPDVDSLSLPQPDAAMVASEATYEVEFQEPSLAVTLDDPPPPIRGSAAIDTTISASTALEPASSQWLAAVGIIWMAGALVYVTVLVWRCTAFRRVLSASTPAGAEIAESAHRLAARLGLRRCPQVRMVEAIVPPLVWSLGLRPLIVLPSKLVSELSPAGRDTLVAHELAHVRRRDDLVRWLEIIALVAFWWNPLAWFARKRLREAEEECCDAWVVWALPSERKSYGQAMLATIEFLSDGPKLPALAGSTFGGSFYKRRIEMIMKRNVSRKISWAALGIIMLTAVAALPIVAQTASSDDKPKVASATEAAATADEARAADPGNAEDPGVLSDAAPVGSAEADESGIAASTAMDDADRDAVESREDLLRRIKRLEERLTAAEPLQTGRRNSGGGSSPWPSASQRLPTFDVSPDEREQRLQEQLLQLDVEAAKADIEPAKIKWERSMEANKKQPGTVSDLAVEQLRAELIQKQVQLQRAETLLELFKRQLERKRKEPSRPRRDQPPGTSDLSAADADLYGLHPQEITRLSRINDRLSKDFERLEKQLKESPQSPETRQAVDQFLKTYRNMADPGTQQDLIRKELARLWTINDRLSRDRERLERLLKSSPDSTEARIALDRFLKNYRDMPDPANNAETNPLKAPARESD